MSRVRSWAYEMLEAGASTTWGSRLTARAIVALIVLNLVAVALESVPELEARYGVWFTALEYASLAVFTAEYALRLWTASDHPPQRHLSAGQARWSFATSPSGIIDLLSVLPFWLAFLVPAELRVILVLRIVRFLKLTRYSAAMRSLIEVLYAERRALFGCLVILMGATLIAATAMHLIERHAQPDKFGTIPDAMWWAIVTLGTIGYGDVVPATAAGKIVATLTIFTGLIMVALPVGIVATAFADEIHRRQFVVTWGMVARVPLFGQLNATEIADILRLLRAQMFEAGSVIVRRGEAAHSMYFIAAGEVDIELPQKRLRLRTGQFFGEVAVLRRSRRSATVTAVSRTSLLVLDAADLHALMERDPRIAKSVQHVMRDRVGREIVTPRGDIVTEEFAEPGSNVDAPDDGRPI